MAAVEQSVRVTGEGHRVVTVGRDLVVADTYVQQKAEFFEPSLEPFKPPRFTSPQIAPQLVEVIRNQRLLVLGGSQAIDKSALARHVAWRLGETLLQEQALSGDGIPILEWYRSSDPQSLVVALRETETTTVFILPQILPQHVSYDLFRIQNAASSGQHYVVASTDTPFAGWKLPDSAKKFWLEVSPEGLYGADDLANVLIQKLIDAAESLPPGLLEGDLKPERPLVGNLPIRTVAERLKTPDNIAVFVQSLCAEKGPLEEKAVRNLIELAQDNKRVLGQWYHTLLGPREQLLALGLGFFDGIFDDQLFAALEEVVEGVWQRRDTSLRALDYCDLDNLRNFFSFVEAEAYGTKIESRLPEQRQMLFEVAWNSHRRQILTALPVVAQLVRNSVAWRSLNTELYGTSVRRDQLRRVIGEALSDIGLISTSAVEDTLLQLAVDEEMGVQAVAARAMARWRYYGRDKELFDTLQRWQLETHIIDLIDSILKGRDEEVREGPRAYIRATVALTVSYAAQYDPPNTLSEELCDLIDQLSIDPNRLVRNRFRYHTLPMVVPLHVAQLRDILHDMTRYTDLDHAIGASLALAYRENPEEVLKTLNLWHKECVETRPRRVNEAEITPRENLLATVALAYGEIRYDEAIGPLSGDEAFRRLRSILAEERHPFVRTAVVIAISRQARRHFDKVESLLQKLVAEVTENERIEIVKILTDIYLEQRKNLKDGEDIIEVKGHRYPIWIDSARPITGVERAMYRWSRDAEKPAAQQIAIQASIAFARELEQEEAQRIDEIRKERERVAEEAEEAEGEAVIEPAISKRPKHSSFMDQLASRLATLRLSHYRLVILGLLPEALAQYRSSRDLMNLVLSKWRRTRDDEMKDISKLLKRAIGLAQNIWVLLIGGFIVLCVLCSTFYCLVSSVLGR